MLSLRISTSGILVSIPQQFPTLTEIDDTRLLKFTTFDCYIYLQICVRQSTNLNVQDLGLDCTWIMVWLPADGTGLFEIKSSSCSFLRQIGVKNKAFVVMLA